MSLSVRCPACLQRYVVDDRVLGRQVKCRKCDTVIKIPGPADPSPSAAAESLRSEPPPREADDEDRPTVAWSDGDRPPRRGTPARPVKQSRSPASRPRPSKSLIAAGAVGLTLLIGTAGLLIWMASRPDPETVPVDRWTTYPVALVDGAVRFPIEPEVLNQSRMSGKVPVTFSAAATRTADYIVNVIPYPDGEEHIEVLAEGGAERMRQTAIANAAKMGGMQTPEPLRRFGTLWGFEVDGQAVFDGDVRELRIRSYFLPSHQVALLYNPAKPEGRKKAADRFFETFEPPVFTDELLAQAEAAAASKLYTWSGGREIELGDSGITVRLPNLKEEDDQPIFYQDRNDEIVRYEVRYEGMTFATSLKRQYFTRDQLDDQQRPAILTQLDAGRAVHGFFTSRIHAGTLRPADGQTPRLRTYGDYFGTEYLSLRSESIGFGDDAVPSGRGRIVHTPRYRVTLEVTEARREDRIDGEPVDAAVAREFFDSLVIPPPSAEMRAKAMQEVETVRDEMRLSGRAELARLLEQPLVDGSLALPTQSAEEITASVAAASTVPEATGEVDDPEEPKPPREPQSPNEVVLGQSNASIVMPAVPKEKDTQRFPRGLTTTVRTPKGTFVARVVGYFPGDDYVALTPDGAGYFRDRTLDAERSGSSVNYVQPTNLNRYGDYLGFQMKKNAKESFKWTNTLTRIVYLPKHRITLSYAALEDDYDEEAGTAFFETLRLPPMPPGAVERGHVALPDSSAGGQSFGGGFGRRSR